MKKLLLFISVLALTILASCQKETFKDSQAVKYGSIILEAEVEMPALSDTKTVLNGTAVEWRRGDLIKVFSKDGSSIKMEAQGDGTSVQFREVVEGEEAPVTFKPAYAIYPYSEDAVIEGDKMKFSTSQDQAYTANTFAPGANVAFGKISSKGKLQFKNAFGVLKFSLKGAGTVEKIVLKGHNNEDLCGNMSVKLSTFNEPVVSIDEGTDNEEIVLECGDGVALDTSATAFYFVVPAGSFSTGFTATAYCGEYNHAEVSTTKNNIVNRSKVRDMKETKEAYILPKEYRQLEWIESTGYQCINTGIYTHGSKMSAVVDFSVSKLCKRGNSDLILSNYGQSKEGESDMFTANIYQDKWRYKVSNVAGFGDVWDTERHTYYINTKDKGTRLDDGTPFITDQLTINAIDIPICLFATLNSHGTYCEPSCIKLYSCIIYDDNAVVRNFIPCFNTNTLKSGLYDFVSEVFYFNDLGDEVNFKIPEIEDYVTEVEYIQATAVNDWFATDLTASNNKLAAVIDFEITTLPTDAHSHIIAFSPGYGKATNTPYFLASIYNNKWRSKVNESAGYGNTPEVGRHIFYLNTAEKGSRIDNQDALIDDQLQISDNPDSKIIMLGMPDEYGLTTDTSVKGIKLYSAIFYDGTDLVAKLVPMNSLLHGGCLYDEVAHKLYYSNNSTFVAGPVIDE